MHKAALLPIIAVAFLSHAPAAESAESAENRKAVARRVFLEIFNQGKFEVANEIYAKDFVDHGITRDIGLKEDQDAARGWRSAFADLHMAVDKVLVDGHV